MPLFLCSFIVPETGDWLAVDPRSALRIVTEKYDKKGLKCMSGAEFEASLWLPCRLVGAEADVTFSISSSKRRRPRWRRRSLLVYKLLLRAVGFIIRPVDCTSS